MNFGQRRQHLVALGDAGGAFAFEAVLIEEEGRRGRGHVEAADGTEMSSIAIRAKIKKLISQENPDVPLSDAKLAEILSQEGIPVARRTVAKYREDMKIPSTHQRRVKK